MTESDLVEAAARATYEQTEVSHNGVATTWNTAGNFKRETYRRLVGIALASTSIPLDRLAALASGEAWIAPMEPPKEMISAGEDKLEDETESDYDSNADGERHHYEYFRPGHIRSVFIAMRDRYLTPEEPDAAEKG